MSMFPTSSRQHLKPGECNRHDVNYDILYDTVRANPINNARTRLEWSRVERHPALR